MLVLLQLTAASAVGFEDGALDGFEDGIEEFDEDVCATYAVGNISEACAAWVNHCCPTHVWPWGIDLAVAPDGSRVFVTAEPADSGVTAHTFALDPDSGEMLWKVSDDTGPRSPKAITVDPDSSKVFVAGWGPDLVAYDAATGAHLWSQNNPKGGFADLAISPDGETLFATGSRTLAAYNVTTGDRLWMIQDTPSQAVGVGSSGSRVFVTGTHDVTIPEQDWVTAAYDAATGKQLWVRTLDGGAGSADAPNSIVVNPADSIVYVVGAVTVRPSSGPDYGIAAYEATTGERAWLDTYNGPGDTADVAQDLVASSDGSRVYLTGKSHGGETQFDFATIAYNATTGERAWLTRYDYPLSDVTIWDDDRAQALVVSPDGSRVYVTGASWQFTNPPGFSFPGDGWTGAYVSIAYDAQNGSEEWVARYDPNGAFDAARAIGVLPDGSRVFVAGASSIALEGTMARTVAYNATGPDPIVAPLVENPDR